MSREFPARGRRLADWQSIGATDMGRRWIGWCNGAALAAVMGLAGGCAWYDDMVDQQDLRRNPPSSTAAYTRQQEPTVTYARQQDPAVDQTRQEVAAMRVDLNTLQDNQRRLLAQIGELQDAIATRDTQIEELRNLVAGLESRVKTADAEWQTRMDNLRQSMTEQNKQKLDAMADQMAREIARQNPQNARAAGPTVAGEFTVRQGDVLSAIATAYGVSLKDLMDINGLKDDRIRVGQKLKIPAPRR